MTKFALALIAAALPFAAAPAFATEDAASYGHQTGYGYHQPQYHPTYKPSYEPTYHPTYTPKHEPTVTTYEHRPAYVWVRVKGYCKDEVTKKGYQVYRKTIECKAGEPEKTPEPAPAPVEPPK